MMNKLKIFYLLILCLVTIGGAAGAAQAQSGADKVLVAGSQPLKQSEINQLIKFYEWAFQTTFSPDERARYQAYVVEGFRQNAAEARKGVDVIIKVLAKMRDSDADRQAEMRRAFNESFVPDLRAANDAESKMMLGIYERGQNKNTGGEIKEILPSEEDLNETAPALPVGKGTAQLVGKWQRSVGAGRGDDGTGKTTYESGTNYTFEFFADGRMNFLTETKVLSITQCRITETTKIPGTYSINGGEITMNLGAGTNVGTSSCEAKGNFKKTLSASTLQKTFVVKELESVFRPDAPLILCFDGAADDACFERLIK